MNNKDKKSLDDVAKKFQFEILKQYQKDFPNEAIVSSFAKSIQEINKQFGTNYQSYALYGLNINLDAELLKNLPLTE